MTATCTHSIPAAAPILYLAFELGANEWKLGFSTGLGVPVRLRTVGAGNLTMLQREIELAKKKLKLPDDVPVCSCYEAGRDGFWLHRWLIEHGIGNVIVDAASIEVNRRYRRKKTDSLDAAKLVAMLIRHQAGEKLWSVVRVPSREDEERRHLHRDLEEMKAEATQHRNRIRGLLAGVGARVAEINAGFAKLLATVRAADGRELPASLRERLLLEFERLQFVERQISGREQQRNRKVRDGDHEEPVLKVRKLMQLRAIGTHSAWVFVMELFGWRRVNNRRQLASLVGLTPTPYNSGEDEREQGISKAGNRRMRTLLVEIGWCWLQYQEASALSQWYRKRFSGGSKRQKKIGIVALARKLLIALWKYLERDEVPEGAVLVDWHTKLAGLAAKPLPA
jgi:transposase